MSVGQYLQVAAGQLEQAATALKMEASQTRSDAMAQQARQNRDITNMEAEMRVKSIAAMAADADPRLGNEARQLQSKVNEAKQQRDKDMADAEKKARDLEGKMGDLEGKARGLQQQAAGM